MRELTAKDADARWLDCYELVAEVASGGMATVYLARLPGAAGPPRYVAIKRLHPHLAYEPEFVEMFLEEARLAARLCHPNVLPVVAIGTSLQSYYFVMEYVEGGTLGRLLVHATEARQRLPIKVGLRVALDMLAGLHAAHELTDDQGTPLGVVHRDVSPQNVLVGVDGTARLSDFGVARATQRPRTTREGRLKGKIAYMAPEQAQGLEDIDRRADIFAAGIVLWEVLAGRRLFKGDGGIDTLHRVQTLPIPPVRAVEPAVPAVLEAVVAKALQRDRDKRFATAAELGEALERSGRVLGALATTRELATHVGTVLGVELTKQREDVRAWVGGATGSPSVPAMNLSNRPPPSQSTLPSVTMRPGGAPAAPRRAGSSWTWAVVAAFGAVVAAAVGLGARGRPPQGTAASPSRPDEPPALDVPCGSPSRASVPPSAPAASSTAPRPPASSPDPAAPDAAPRERLPPAPVDTGQNQVR